MSLLRVRSNHLLVISLISFSVPADLYSIRIRALTPLKKEAILHEVIVACWQEKMEQMNVAPWTVVVRLMCSQRSETHSHKAQEGLYPEWGAGGLIQRKPSFIIFGVRLLNILPYYREDFMQFTMVYKIKQSILSVTERENSIIIREHLGGYLDSTPPWLYDLEQVTQSTLHLCVPLWSRTCPDL